MTKGNSSKEGTIKLKRLFRRNKSDNPELTRFHGNGLSFLANLIGYENVVYELDMTDTCHQLMQDLKAWAKSSGKHKDRVKLIIRLDGITINNLSSGVLGFYHPVEIISFITMDTLDPKSFGYVFCSPAENYCHKFIAFRADKPAELIVSAFNDLVTYLKNESIERTSRIFTFEDAAPGESSTDTHLSQPSTPSSFIATGTNPSNNCFNAQSVPKTWVSLNDQDSLVQVQTKFENSQSGYVDAPISHLSSRDYSTLDSRRSNINDNVRASYRKKFDASAECGFRDDSPSWFPKIPNSFSDDFSNMEISEPPTHQEKVGEILNKFNEEASNFTPKLTYKSTTNSNQSNAESQQSHPRSPSYLRRSLVNSPAFKSASESGSPTLFGDSADRKITKLTENQPMVLEKFSAVHDSLVSKPQSPRLTRVSIASRKPSDSGSSFSEQSYEVSCHFDSSLATPKSANSADKYSQFANVFNELPTAADSAGETFANVLSEPSGGEAPPTGVQSTSSEEDNSLFYECSAAPTMTPPILEQNDRRYESEKKFQNLEVIDSAKLAVGQASSQSDKFEVNFVDKSDPFQVDCLIMQTKSKSANSKTKNKKSEGVNEKPAPNGKQSFPNQESNFFSSSLLDNNEFASFNENFTNQSKQPLNKSFTISKDTVNDTQFEQSTPPNDQMFHDESSLSNVGNKPSKNNPDAFLDISFPTSQNETKSFETNFARFDSINEEAPPPVPVRSRPLHTIERGKTIDHPGYQTSDLGTSTVKSSGTQKKLGQTPFATKTAEIFGECSTRSDNSTPSPTIARRRPRPRTGVYQSPCSSPVVTKECDQQQAKNHRANSDYRSNGTTIFEPQAKNHAMSSAANQRILEQPWPASTTPDPVQTGYQRTFASAEPVLTGLNQRASAELVQTGFQPTRTNAEPVLTGFNQRTSADPVLTGRNNRISRRYTESPLVGDEFSRGTSPADVFVRRDSQRSSLSGGGGSVAAALFTADPFGSEPPEQVFSDDPFSSGTTLTDSFCSDFQPSQPFATKAVSLSGAELGLDERGPLKADPFAEDDFFKSLK